VTAAHAFPEPPAVMAPTPIAEVDLAVLRVASKKDAWPGVGIPERISYLERAMAGMAAVASRWAEAGARAKGIDPFSPQAGEEWLTGPWQVMRNLRLLIRALSHGGKPPAKIRESASGQLVARVLPLDLYDRAMFAGFSGELLIELGKPATQGAIYRRPPVESAEKKGKLALVLGAGNVSSIGPMDALYKLFAEDEVVVLKMNPVNAYTGPFVAEAFRALVDDGFLAIVYGGGEIGAHLANHPEVDTLHVTGSDRTYDAIVWGGASSADRMRRKAAGERLNTRPFTAELGCVTPVLVVPGPWSAGDMEFHARQVAGMVANNASFNCVAAKVLVTAYDWLQRRVFLEKVESALRRTPPRKAYYPGAKDRYAAFLREYPDAKVLGQEGEDVVPWTVLPNVPPRAGEYALSNEAFCGVIAETSLEADGPREFLDKAVLFANDACWGTLSCVLLVHPSTLRDYAKEIDAAILQLRYGAIAVNCWSALAYALITTSWGAFPGHPPADIGSGAGVVHNALLFDHPQKSVVRAPFRIWPKPQWFADHRNLAEVGRRLTAFEAAPSWGKVASLAAAAVQG
jgi:acyl-CoA reductase-like NAD-dependent aldehyde dehydrogenase